MPEPADTRVRDTRRTYTFYMDDALIDIYGPQIGAYGVALYALLARYAKHHEAWPGYKTMAAQLHISRMTVIRTLQCLARVGLIEIDTRHTPDGDYDTKLYRLCDLSKGRGGISQIPPGTSQIPGWSTTDTTVVSQVDQKESQKKESQLRDPDLPPTPMNGGVKNFDPKLGEQNAEPLGENTVCSGDESSMADVTLADVTPTPRNNSRADGTSPRQLASKAAAAVRQAAKNRIEDCLFCDVRGHVELRREDDTVVMLRCPHDRSTLRTVMAAHDYHWPAGPPPAPLRPP